MIKNIEAYYSLFYKKIKLKMMISRIKYPNFKSNTFKSNTFHFKNYTISKSYIYTNFTKDEIIIEKSNKIIEKWKQAKSEDDVDKFMEEICSQDEIKIWVGVISELQKRFRKKSEEYQDESLVKFAKPWLFCPGVGCSK